jgi:transposase InsO family protein
MSVIDSVSNRVHCIPTHTTISAEGAAQSFYQEVWKLAVLLDRGSQFIAEFTHELYRILGIKPATSTAYHPQTDGQTKCFNQELEGYLRIFTNQHQDNWDGLLPSAEFTHNNHAHSSTQHTPFCKGNPNSLSEQLSLKTNQGESKVNI